MNNEELLWQIKDLQLIDVRLILLSEVIFMVFYISLKA